jgi:hypothetical protein
MNTRQKVLEEALKCVNGEREKQYGSPEDNFRRIADLWSTYLTSLFEDEKVVVDIDPIDVAKMMILFKIARSNGDEDKLDNYVDMIGYAACGAEIFENENKGRIFVDEWVEKMKKLGGNGEESDARQKIEKLAFNSLDCEHCKYEPMDSREYPCSKCDPDENGGTLFESDERKKVEKIELADECKDCDYAKKCMGTGVCLKEKEKECIKDKPKWKAYSDISTHIAIKSYRANINVFDVVDRLTKNGNSPTEMAALLQSGELGFGDVASYVDDAINEVKKESKK